MRNSVNHSQNDPLNFIRETRIKNAMERWEFLSSWLARVRAQYDLTTDVSERIRQEAGILEKESELEKVEQEIRVLEKH